jgi:F-type H+-transporting ATPase subunit gamma
MQLVAAARMRRAQQDILSARPYAEKLDAILKRLVAAIDTSGSPLMIQRAVDRVAVCVITSDRGLCGGFNASICRRAVSELESYSEQEVLIDAVGRKGRNYFRNRDYSIGREYIDVFRDLQLSSAIGIAQDLQGRFLSGEVDRVLLVYNEFLSTAHQTPVVRQLLPIVPEDVGDSAGTTQFLFEPDAERLLDSLVPRHVNFQVWRALLESNAGEQASRMQAMDSATKNAGDLIEDLTRELNKVRQSSITLELMDIIGGAEAVS